MATDKNITIHTSKGDIKLTVFASKTPRDGGFLSEPGFQGLL